MRKVVYGAGISLDGYIARPDGAVDFLFMPKDYSMGPFFKTIDIAIMGRKTYEAALKMGGSGGSFGGMATYVLSRSMPSGERDGVTFLGDSPDAVVKRLRAQKGKDIWLMGGGELARSFLEADLVDELHLGVVPVLIGEGLPAFPPRFHGRKFSLVENQTYSKGLVALKYRRKRRWTAR